MARLATRAALVGAVPGWERELALWLEEAARADDEAVMAWNASPEEAALGPLLVAAGEALSRQLAHVDVRMLPSAHGALVGLLSRRLVAACAQVLAYERRAIEAVSGGPAALDASPKGWLQRLEAYPVLAALLTRCMQDWRVHVLEMLSRLAVDSELLGRTLLRGAPVPVLAGVLGDLGDPHGGRSVAVLEFEGGLHAVYKPKDLRITREVQAFCAFLNERGLPLSLHVREVLCRDGYTWEEFVAAGPCPSAAAAERFYFRMGMLVRLLQLLEGRDLWLDNVVAAGEFPVLVDLEMVLQPRRRVSPGPLAPRLAEERLHESVALLGILAAPLAIAPGVPAEDVGALTPPRVFRSPLRRGHARWTRDAHAPMLAGEPVRAVEHLDALLEGYRAMHARLRASRQELLAAGSPLARMARLPVRYIHRNTWSCHRLIQAGLAPALLSQRERREEAFSSLLRGARAHPEAEVEGRVVRAEVDAMRWLDVPYFLCHADGDALLGADGQPLQEDFFEGDALSRLRRRIRELDAFPLGRHEELLRSTLATGRHVLAPSEPVWAEEEASPDWLAEAIGVGDTLLGEASSAGGALAWLGMTYQPLHDLWQLDVLPADMLTGSAGIALVLANLYEVSGLERFRTAALGALEPVRWTVAHSSTQPFVETGAFRGIGAQLHVLHQCGIVLEAPELRALARARLAALPLEELLARTSLDVVSGMTGLLLVLLASEELEAARLVVEVLEQRLATDAAPPPWTGFRTLDGLPPLAEGLALCAGRVEKRLGSAPRWQCFASRESDTLGALLTRLAVAREQARPGDSLRPRVLRALEEARAASSVAVQLDAIELALDAARTWEDAALTTRARRFGAALLARRRLRGRWFPERLEADAHNLSAIWGLSAVAHAFLRLHEPRLSSPRLLAPVDEAPGGRRQASS
ncbi:hypothetical protein BON30_39235 [Cystobacter ferrugineus]|uniref:Lantibiotic biosynthesis protein dehydration domain-containing protein n=1 Tax=Cystobacter ferrugineus TaxID=83449 RepID=A0A1L9AYM3_9BACT|nr:hypothetical protein BON30_39235 [Cystobacter ferrugineus]